MQSVGTRLRQFDHVVAVSVLKVSPCALQRIQIQQAMLGRRLRYHNLRTIGAPLVALTAPLPLLLVFLRHNAGEVRAGGCRIGKLGLACLLSLVDLVTEQYGSDL